nr:putative serine/threonine protein kinase [Kibdelosporangium sp. MJ126-NF4]
MPTDEDRLVAGRYRLGQRIGSGAMGVVWQAHDERLHRTVAVKQLLTQPGLTTAQAEEGRLRAMREGRIAARLQHPNAITVYDVVEDDGQPWLVMEYLPSRSLAAELDERITLPPQEAARIGTEVAAGLVAAHAAGIVHRDIKPANVLLGNDGSVKITDFGISRAVGDVTVTATGMLAGTPAYLAPRSPRAWSRRRHRTCSRWAQRCTSASKDTHRSVSARTPSPCSTPSPQARSPRLGRQAR